MDWKKKEKLAKRKRNGKNLKSALKPTHTYKQYVMNVKTKGYEKKNHKLNTNGKTQIIVK